VASSQIAVAYGNSGSSLPKHMADIKRQIDRSLADPETTMLAGKLVSSGFDFTMVNGVKTPVVYAWNKPYWAPEGGPCRMRDAQCEIQRMWDFVVLNIRYTFDSKDVDTFKTLRMSLESHAGDCDDALIAFAALLKAVGFDVIARVISSTGESWDHVYTLVGCPHDNPTKWVVLDPTVDNVQLGWEYPHAKAHQDFRV
jgi:hypothetical protein